MTTLPTSPAAKRAARALPYVLLLFAGSGCAALIYEIVWYQLLQLAIGSTAVSLGVLLATFMGGLCLGSLALPRLRRDWSHPIRIYALIEIGIGICGLLVLWGLPSIDRVYVAGAQHGLPGMLLRGGICSICLLVPTFLMGASLPAITRFVDASPSGVAWWGWLYAGNTVGAVFGCLLAGFYLLRLHDMVVATYVAVAINVAVALLSLAVAAMVPFAAPEPAAQPAAIGAAAAGDAAAVGAETSVSAPQGPLEREPNWPVLWTIGISGATALGAEVVWTRLLGMMFGGTTYAFSIILGVFLIGLAVGSGIGAVLVRLTRARAALGWCQLLLAAGIFWAAFMICTVLPYMQPLLSINAWDVARGDLLRAALALLPATLLWGASFPLAMAALAQTSHDPAEPVGGVYAANTFGGILGALAVSLVLVVWIGTRDSQRLLVLLAAASGILVLAPRMRQRRALAAGVLAALVAALLLAGALPGEPGNLVAYGRRLTMFAPQSQLLDVVEGRNSSVAITRYNDGATQISVAGHVEASTEPFDMRLQRMVGHLPALLHPDPQTVLGIGFGAGVSAGTFTSYPTVKSITICEIEPKVPPTSTQYFAAYDNDVMHNPRTTIVYDDARHYVLTTSRKFDIIASDPLDVWVKGTANIYSLDYFEMVKQHLNPGGYFSLYVPLYESDEATVRSEFATFFAAFPYGTVWANTINGQGYDLVLMGQNEPLHIDIDAVEARLHSPAYAAVMESMQQIGFNSATDLFSTFAAQQSDLAGWLRGAQINNDRNLRLMYLAGWGFNADLEDPLYREIIGFRRPPTNLFSGSDQALGTLFQQMQSSGLR